MISIICATNRPKNQTQKVVDLYKSLLEAQGEACQVLGMNQVPADFIVSESYGNRSEEFEGLVSQYLIAAKAFVIIAPEYNGSYPGVFKAFLDANDPKIFAGKKIALVGVASGRAGNLRGIDHLAQVAHHLGMHVLPNLVPISKLHELLDAQGNFVDETTKQVLEQQSKELIELC